MLKTAKYLFKEAFDIYSELDKIQTKNVKDHSITLHTRK